MAITFEDVAYEPGGTWNLRFHHFMSKYTGVFVFSFTMFIVVFLRNATIEYSLKFFVCVCANMITRKGLNLGSQNFNMLLYMILAQVGSTWAFVCLKSSLR